MTDTTRDPLAEALHQWVCAPPYDHLGLTAARCEQAAADLLVSPVLAQMKREWQAEALRPVLGLADAWAAVPPYLASDYDRGRVDQRQMCETELREVLDRDEWRP